MIYTIGYQTITAARLRAIISEKRIDRIIDVRSIPYSRIPEKYEFNRNRMRNEFGPLYLWKGDILGGKEGPAGEEGIAYLLRKHKRGCVLILLCVEADPRRCHRFFDIGARLLARGIDASHISGDTIFTTSQLIKEDTHG